MATFRICIIGHRHDRDTAMLEAATTWHYTVLHASATIVRRWLKWEKHCMETHVRPRVSTSRSSKDMSRITVQPIYIVK